MRSWPALNEVMAGPSPVGLQPTDLVPWASTPPGARKKAWITGTSPVMTTMSGADTAIYTRILGTGQS
jgi:hypothetical protein